MIAPLHPSVSAALRMSFLAARLLQNSSTVFVGIGAPCSAAMIAKRTHAPELELIFESGVMGADPDRLPLSTGSPSIARGASMIGSMLDVFATLQRGEIDVGLLSGAQVDRKGNLNSTVIGDYQSPKVRLPGSGGAHDIALLAREVIILMPHDPRRFVEAVPFITSPGHVAARGRITGLGAGPSALVTDRALFQFENGEMALAGHYSDISPEDAVKGIPWQVPHAALLEEIAPPPLELASQSHEFLGGNE
jgi:glutaconate CoA-transferase subunit B